MKKEKTVYREIELGGQKLPYELHLGDYKNLNLRVRSNGSIRLSANRRVTMAAIDAFFHANETFILRALDRIAHRAEETDASPWQDGGTVPILGKERTIRVTSGNRNDAWYDDESIFVTVRTETEEEIRGVMRKLLERESERWIKDMSPTVRGLFGNRPVPEHEYRFRFMTSMWGSCCPSKQCVTFNKYLACVPPACIEYVMIHETAHFFELNHSPAFWKLVGEILPDWKERRKALAPYGLWLRKL